MDLTRQLFIRQNDHSMRSTQNYFFFFLAHDLVRKDKNSKIENKMCSPTNFPCFHGQLYDKNTIG